MKVTLNINEDAELRAHIKEAIRGQVISIAREEVVKLLGDILAQKVPTVDPEKVVKEEILRITRATLDNGSWGKASYIQEQARIEVQKLVKEILSKSPLLS